MEKNMKFVKNNLFKNYAILLVFLMLLEIVFRAISNISILNIALLRIFLGLNFISLIISFILSWFSKKIQKIGVILVCVVATVYAFLQIGFNNFIGVYISLNASSQAGAVKDYIREFLASFLWYYYLIYIPLILLVIYYIFIDKKLFKNEYKFKLKKYFKHEYIGKSVVTACILVLLGFVYTKTLTIQSELQIISNKDLFNYPSVPSLAINQFGILGFGILDVKSLYVEENTDYDYVDEDVSSVEEVKTRTFDDSLWEELIETESSYKLNKINKYLLSQSVTDYNDYTGIFEGKNLIGILMESVNDIIINEELYPNFYKLYSNGITFTNNYSPRNSCATGNNEFSALTGLYTIQNNCTANTYKENTYYEGIFNLFNNKGYTTKSMHDYTEAYYYRSTIHTNIGAMEFYGVQKLGIAYDTAYENWASDEDFMNAAMDIQLNDLGEEPFMLWLTTVSPHQPYVVSSIEGDKYYDLTEGTDYPTDLRRYMSKLKTLDNALGILLDRLEEAGILDDTVIVLFGDHYPYGLKKDTISKVLTYDLDDYEIERTPMVIYNTQIEHVEVDKYSSYINLTPTLANMFNLDYDPRLYLGKDVMSDDYVNMVAFADGSWKNDKVYYNASKSTIKYYTLEEVDTETIKNITSIVSNRMQISKEIIRNNYFEYLDEALEELRQNKQDILNDKLEN
jgi:hypothetical protein